MVSIPTVRPGDQAWWHCGPSRSLQVDVEADRGADVIHGVESVHAGTGPSAVLYIPSVPLTAKSVEYVRDQRESFLAARPPPDFPGGVGESAFRDTGRDEEVTDLAGRNA